MTSVTKLLANAVAQGVPVRLSSVNASASSGIAAIRPTMVIAAEITAPARQTQRSRLRTLSLSSSTSSQRLQSCVSGVLSVGPGRRPSD